jgi:hypothetical protein
MTGCGNWFGRNAVTGEIRLELIKYFGDNQRVAAHRPLRPHMSGLVLRTGPIPLKALGSEANRVVRRTAFGSRCRPMRKPMKGDPEMAWNRLRAFLRETFRGKPSVAECILVVVLIATVCVVLIKLCLQGLSGLVDEVVDSMARDMP